jgi:hypothetical protein
MKPPRFAEWLLAHFAPGPLTDALAGDLAEEFLRRQSRAWYWRQVLIAVANALWRYVPILAAWTLISYRFMPRVFMWVIPMDRRTWYWSLSRAWRLPCFFAISIATDTAAIAIGLFLALAATRELRLRAFLGGLLPALLVSTFGVVAIALHPPPRGRLAYASVICFGLVFALRAARKQFPQIIAVPRA